MAYRLRYQVWVDWVPAGVGPGLSNPQGPGMAPAGPAQTLGFFNSQSGTTSVASPSVAAGQALPPNSTTFTSSDVTNLVGAMAADIAAQMDVAAILTRVQNFSSGGG